MCLCTKCNTLGRTSERIYKGRCYRIGIIYIYNIGSIIYHRDCDRSAIRTAATRITYIILWRLDRRNEKTTLRGREAAAVLYRGDFNARPATAIIYL